MGSVVVVGDAFVDRDVLGSVERVCPDAPAPVVDVRSVTTRPGGAALAAALLATEGVDVTLVCALGRDPAGRELRRLLRHLGVGVRDLGLRGPTPLKVRVRVDGHSVTRLDHGGPPARCGEPERSTLAAVRDADAVLVSDYGRGITSGRRLRDVIGRARRVVWDPHPRGADPTVGAMLVTPNAAEAGLFTGMPRPDGPGTAAARAVLLASRWQSAGVVVTLGARGAVLVGHARTPLVVPAPIVEGGDACGAGDRFAGAAAQALADGCVLSEAVERAVVAASAYVADSRPAARRRPAGADDVVARTRLSGGIVVATGGCFDLLHAGHISLLQAARQLGDCLVVLLNSDASVRRLKGSGRPVQCQEDRAAVLRAIGCVDDVLLFDDDTPEQALRRLRPDLYVKGADYTVEELPERAALESWGGAAVVVPYLDGRSTSRLVEEVSRHARIP